MPLPRRAVPLVGEVPDDRKPRVVVAVGGAAEVGVEAAWPKLGSCKGERDIVAARGLGVAVSVRTNLDFAGSDAEVG